MCFTKSLQAMMMIMFSFGCFLVPHVPAHSDLTSVLIHRWLFLPSGSWHKSPEFFISRVPHGLPPQVTVSVANPSLGGKRYSCQFPLFLHWGWLLRRLCLHLWLFESRRFSGHYKVSSGVNIQKACGRSMNNYSLLKDNTTMPFTS